mgnify:CR=1 FL=1
MDNWFNGSSQHVSFEDIAVNIQNHSKKGGTVYIGTDSQIVKKECIFSTAIVLHGAKDQEGGNFYIKREKFGSKKFSTLLERIYTEVENSVQIAMRIIRNCPKVDIELHLDISGSEEGEKTSKFADMLMGYAKGVGFECKIKPNAFAATTVADKFNK